MTGVRWFALTQVHEQVKKKLSQIQQLEKEGLATGDPNSQEEIASMKKIMVTDTLN